MVLPICRTVTGVVTIRERGAFTIAGSVSDGAIVVDSYEAGQHLPTFRSLDVLAWQAICDLGRG